MVRVVCRALLILHNGFLFQLPGFDCRFMLKTVKAVSSIVVKLLQRAASEKDGDRARVRQKVVAGRMRSWRDKGEDPKMAYAANMLV
jgi:hypothetical protein